MGRLSAQRLTAFSAPTEYCHDAGMDEVIYRPLKRGDAGEALTVQRAAFIAEASGAACERNASSPAK
jgi:hypothetical protein